MVESRIAKLLEDANMMAAFYKSKMVEASDHEIQQSLDNPETAKVILYLVDLLQ